MTNKTSSFHARLFHGLCRDLMISRTMRRETVSFQTEFKCVTSFQVFSLWFWFSHPCECVLYCIQFGGIRMVLPFPVPGWNRPQAVYLRPCKVLPQFLECVSMNAPVSKTRENIYRSFSVYSDVYRSFFPIKTTFIKYCLTQWISKVLASFEFHWEKQYLVNFTALADIVNEQFTRPSQFSQVLGMANCHNL